MKHTTALLSASIVLLLVTSGFGQATRNTGERRQRNIDDDDDFVFERQTVMIEPYVTGGLLFGEAVEPIEDGWRKAVYGFGLSGDYRLSTRFRICLVSELVWNKPDDHEDAIVRMWSWRAGGMFIIRPESKSSVYLRGEAGFGSIRATAIDRDLGTHATIRVGIGLQSFTRSSLATRTELYYRAVLTEGYDEPVPFAPEPIPFDLNQIGVRLAMAIGL